MIGDTNALIKKHKLKLQRRYGQHFLTDENIINKIVASCELDKKTAVIEVGTGIGNLTAKLCEVAGHVVTFEVDKILEPAFNERMEKITNYQIYYLDFMKVNLNKVYGMLSEKYQRISFISNLPYYITTDIIMKLVEANLDFASIVVMMQTDAYARLTAGVGTKDYSPANMILEYHYHVEKLFDVSKNVFTPPPLVESSMIKFIPRTSKKAVCDLEKFYLLTFRCFENRRKTILNNLGKYLNSKDKAKEALEALKIDVSLRPENLSLDDYLNLTNYIHKSDD